MGGRSGDDAAGNAADIIEYHGDHESAVRIDHAGDAVFLDHSETFVERFGMGIDRIGIKGRDIGIHRFGGQLAFAFVQDRARMGGAFGRYSAKKIISLYDELLK